MIPDDDQVPILQTDKEVTIERQTPEEKRPRET